MIIIPSLTAFANNQALTWLDTGSTVRDALNVNASDQIVIGGTGLATIIIAPGGTTVGTWDSGGLTLGTAKAIDGTTSVSQQIGGTTVGTWTAGGLALANITLTGTAPQLKFIETGATANNLYWDILVDAEVFKFRAGNDAQDTFVDIMSVERTANAIDSVTWAGATIFNEAGGDFDFRVETDTNPNAFTIDGGVNTGVGSVAFGKAAIADISVAFDALATSATTGTSFARVKIENTNAITNIASSTMPMAASLWVEEPNLTQSGTAIAFAASVYIAGAPDEGGVNYSLFSDAGAIRLDTDAFYVLAESTQSRIEYTTAGGIVFNQDGEDVNFRVEADGNPNGFVVDAGLNGGQGSIAFGAAPAASNTRYFDLNPGAITVTANTHFHKFLIENDGALTVQGGTTSGLISTMTLFEPNIIATGTVTVGATLYIANQSTEATTNAGIYVKAGIDTMLADAAIATNATLGFVQIAACAGPATGTPANYIAGTAMLVFDSTNNSLYVYDGAWTSVALS